MIDDKKESDCDMCGKSCLPLPKPPYYLCHTKQNICGECFELLIIPQ